jgi:hypothetical protein
MNIKLAEALLRRKELEGKLRVLADVDAKALYETRARRVKVTDSVDDIVADVPKLTPADVTKHYDFVARQLRRVDAAIQQANWTTEIEVQDEVMADFTK